MDVYLKTLQLSSLGYRLLGSLLLFMFFLLDFILYEN